METTILKLWAKLCLTLPTLLTLVSALVSKATDILDANDTLDTPLPGDLPSDDEYEDGLYPTSESEESGSEDEAQDGDVGLELGSTLQDSDQIDPNETTYAEDLESNNFPLLNHAQQAEVEYSQEPGIQLEIEEFGGKAGQPIRVGQPTAANRYGTQSGGDAGGANPYALFCSQIDWEVAKWGKLRGPTSTAFTELLEIPGVSARAM